jgi:hypothetical protein
MYRVSPFTYLIEGFLTTAVADTHVTCAANEYLHFSPPNGQTCAEYMQPFISANGGELQPGTEQNNSDCSFCMIADTNVFLRGVASNPDNMWRDFGIIWVYIFVNVAGAIFFYWLGRVPKGAKKQSQEMAASKEVKQIESTRETVPMASRPDEELERMQTARSRSKSFAREQNGEKDIERGEAQGSSGLAEKVNQL